MKRYVRFTALLMAVLVSAALFCGAAAQEKKVVYSVTVSVPVNGSITAPPTASATENYAFMVTPDPGYEVDEVRVNGNLLGTATPGKYIVLVGGVSGDFTISATFRVVADSFRVTALQSKGGVISPETVSVLPGGNTVFTLKADEGYRLESVVVNGKAVALPGPDGRCTLSNITKDTQISARFVTQGNAPPANFSLDTESYTLDLNGTYTFMVRTASAEVPLATSDAPDAVSVLYKGPCTGGHLFTISGVSLGSGNITVKLGSESLGLPVEVKRLTYSDTSGRFSVQAGETYQFMITAQSKPTLVAGSSSFRVEFAGQQDNRYFFKVTATGKAGDGCGFYLNGQKAALAVAMIQ